MNRTPVAQRRGGLFLTIFHIGCFVSVVLAALLAAVIGFYFYVLVVGGFLAAIFIPGAV